MDNFSDEPKVGRKLLGNKDSFPLLTAPPLSAKQPCCSLQKQALSEGNNRIDGFCAGLIIDGAKSCIAVRAGDSQNQACKNKAD